MANKTIKKVRRSTSNQLFITELNDDRTPDKIDGTVKKCGDADDPICVEPLPYSSTTDTQRSRLSTPNKSYTAKFLTPRSSRYSDTLIDSTVKELHSFSINLADQSDNTVNSLYETCVDTSLRLLSASRSVQQRLRPLLQRLSVGGGGGGRTSPTNIQNDRLNKSEICTCEDGLFDGNCLKSFMEMSVQPAEYRNNSQVMTSTPLITKDVYDHGIFNVARIKKVELHDLSPKVPEFDVIDAAPKDRCINNNNVRVPNGNHLGSQPNQFSSNIAAATTQNQSKDPIQSVTMPTPLDGSVLKKVISFTLDQMNSGESATEREARPSFVPEKLHFSHYGQFKGQLFVKWVSNAIASSQKTELNEINIKTVEMVISEVCTHLIAAGVMKQLVDYDEKTKDVFCPNEMYQWTHVELSRHQPKKEYLHNMHQHDEETMNNWNESTMTIIPNGHEESIASIKVKRSCESSLEIDQINGDYDVQECNNVSMKSDQSIHAVEIQINGQPDAECDQFSKSNCDRGKMSVEISTQTDDLDDQKSDEKSKSDECKKECMPPPPPPPPFNFTVTAPSPTIAPPPPPPPPFSFPSPSDQTDKENQFLLTPATSQQNTIQNSPCKTATILTSASSFCPPPPPPMMNGMVPPPLPLPTGSSGHMWFKSDTLRKAAKHPPKPMINLFWTRILIPKEEEEEKPVEPENPGLSTIKRREKLWQKIDETHLDNAEDFTELFARQATPKRPREMSKLPKKTVIKVLDLKRSQSVGIFSQSLYRHRIDSQVIQRAIYNWDLSSIGLDLLQQMLEHRATPEELIAIKDAQKTSTLNMPLDGPENFLLKFSEINSAPERIACIIFRNEFEELNTQIEHKIKTIRNLCEFLMENSHLGDLFAIILTLGNVMNGGNRYRGQADGFGLDVLNKLKDVKSKDKKTTLLHFIVKTFICKRRQDGQKPKEIAYPLPDTESVKSAATVDFVVLHEQIEQLRKNFEDIKEKIDIVITSSTEQNIQPFKSISEELVRNASSKIDNQYHELDACKVIFRETLDYFKHIPKTGTIDECTPSQFFELWVNFCIDFRDLWRKEISVINAEIFQKYKSIASPKTPQNRPKGKQKTTGLRVRRVNQL